MQRALEAHAREVAEEVLANAKKELEKRLRAEADRVALGVFNVYEMERMRDRLVITVKKDTTAQDGQAQEDG